jgi:hypothetical protein
MSNFGKIPVFRLKKKTNKFFSLINICQKFSHCTISRKSVLFSVDKMSGKKHWIKYNAVIFQDILEWRAIPFRIVETKLFPPSWIVGDVWKLTADYHQKIIMPRCCNAPMLDIQLRLKWNWNLRRHNQKLLCVTLSVYWPLIFNENISYSITLSATQNTAPWENDVGIGTKKNKKNRLKKKRKNRIP